LSDRIDGAAKIRRHRNDEEHFPCGDENAVLLWERWRNALLKDEYPGRVSLSRTGSGTPTGSLSIPARSS
jgi:hypothetical protein